MFAVIALVMLPALAVTGRSHADFGVAFAMPMSFWYFTITVLFPTIASFSLMNRFQREVTASEVGIVYATEPVFASAFALVLPSVLSSLSRISYPNELLHLRLVLGGALVVSANVLLAASRRGQRPA
jgi:drug/metabolite transporter (DMT)-like permease